MPGPGRARMLAAAAIIAREAQRLAAVWSVQIPPSIKVTAGDSTATIKSAVGPSYPNEVKHVRHPVYGTQKADLEALAEGKRHGANWAWVTNEYRPFLKPAAEAKADDAAAEIAKSVDDFCHDLGFKGTG